MSNRIELQTQVAGVLLHVSIMQKSSGLLFSLYGEDAMLSLMVAERTHIRDGATPHQLYADTAVFQLADGEKDRLKEWLAAPQATQQEALA